MIGKILCYFYWHRYHKAELVERSWSKYLVYICDRCGHERWERTRSPFLDDLP